VGGPWGSSPIFGAANPVNGGSRHQRSLGIYDSGGKRESTRRLVSVCGRPGPGGIGNWARMVRGLWNAGADDRGTKIVPGAGAVRLTVHPRVHGARGCTVAPGARTAAYACTADCPADTPSVSLPVCSPIYFIFALELVA